MMPFPGSASLSLRYPALASEKYLRYSARRNFRLAGIRRPPVIFLSL